MSKRTPFGWWSVKEVQIVETVLKRVDNGLPPDCHDQHVDAWEHTSTSGLCLCWESGVAMTEINKQEITDD